MSINKRFFLFAATTVILVLSGIGIYSFTQISNKTEAVIIDSNELIYTKEEESSIGKWRSKSMDDVIKHAHEGDPAGLWMIGFSHLIGAMDFPLDTNIANTYFAWSGSLGFAPSLDQLRRMYFFDMQDPFLALVYLNLTVAAGHKELVHFYHNMRTELIEKFGIKVADEIEKIATHKKNIIAKFVDKIKNKPEDFMEVLLIEGSIVDEDVLFDMEFWRSIFCGQLNTGNLEEWLRDSSNYCRKIERLAEKAQSGMERYELLSDDNE